MSWQRSGELLIMVILGGIGTLNGAIIGAAAFLLTEEWLSGITEHWKVIFGPLLVLVAVFARGGLLGVARQAAEDGPWLTPCCASKTCTKNFGGLRVTDDVTLDVMPGELHAVIGPNGAGKTTLINQISGLLAPDAGRIVFAGEDVTALPVHARARARACALVPDHLDPAALFGAGECRARRAGAARLELPLLRPRGATRSELNAPALAALAQVGLAERADAPAGELSHGEKRALEFAIALAMEPKLLLLDEPMAGTGHDETERLVAVLRGLKGRFPMVLVEHDMTAVFALADRISVLIYGRILASGTPDAGARRPAGRHRLSRRGDGVMLRVENLAGRLRPRAGAVRRELFGRRRRGRDAARPQRHGQDHDHPHADGPACRRAAAARGSRARRCSAARPIASRSAASASCRKAGRCFRRCRSRKIWSRPRRRGTARRTGRLPRVYEFFPRLAERRANMGNQLSGGEQQMLAIGRALMTNPKLLILDEATEGLAPLIRAEIWACLARLKKRRPGDPAGRQASRRADQDRRPPCGDREGPRGVDRHIGGARGGCEHQDAIFAGVGSSGAARRIAAPAPSSAPAFTCRSAARRPMS